MARNSAAGTLEAPHLTELDSEIGDAVTADLQAVFTGAAVVEGTAGPGRYWPGGGS
ncbi:hypothetical protein SMICM304S_06538 [Streptomyces microflavus]